LESVFSTEEFIVHSEIVTHVIQVAVTHHVDVLDIFAGIGITQAVT
jgi:hypothetical protein